MLLHCGSSCFGREADVLAQHTDALMAALYAVAELAAMKEKPVSVYEARGLVSA